MKRKKSGCHFSLRHFLRSWTSLRSTQRCWGSVRVLVCLLCGLMVVKLTQRSSMNVHNALVRRETYGPAGFYPQAITGEQDDVDYYLGKFSRDSRHVLRYEMRRDDILSNVHFPPTNFSALYRQDWRRSWSVVKNVFDAYITDREGITLATQISLSRIEAFKLLVGIWKGPISVAVYIARGQLTEFLVKAKQILAGRHNIFIHVAIRGPEYFYPGNMLRNLAAETIETEYSFLNDGDFLPSTKAEERLHRYKTNLKQRQAFVLPAFAFLENHTSTDFRALDSKEHLLELIKPNGTIHTFAEYSFQPGHRNTDYEKWKTATTMYDIKYELDFEPYVLMFTSDIVHYPETFLGWYYDKASFFIMLAIGGFRYMVLPDVWVVHYYHPISQAMHGYRRCSIQVNEAWKQHLKKRYGVDVNQWKHY